MQTKPILALAMLFLGTAADFSMSNLSGGGQPVPICVPLDGAIPQPPNLPLFKQCGFDQIVIPIGQTSATITENFNPVFPYAPEVKAWGAGGISTLGTEAQYDFDNNVTVTTALTTTMAIFKVNNVAMNAFNPPTNVEFQAQITSNTGTGTPTIWVQGLDCNADGQGIGTMAWEDLGTASRTPAVTTTGKIYAIGNIVALNDTLIQDVQGCLTTQYMTLRVVGINTSGTRTVTITKLTLSIIYTLPPAVLTVVAVYFDHFIMGAVGAPATVSFEWEATA